MDSRYVAERDRNRVAKRTALEEWAEVYASYDAGDRAVLDAWIAAIVDRAHQLGAKNYGPDAARETIIALLHWEDDWNCEQKRQKALRSKNALHFA